MAALSHMAAMIIAIDGPAASGKGTLGKRLAHHYGYRHLDTGVIYRAVAKALLDEGFDLTDEARAVAVARELDPEKFGHPELKSQRIGDAASVVSAIPSVREALVNFQRQFAADPPGAVLDGRDIGTVICPNADVKIFVVADPLVRARRRTLEALSRGEAADEALVLADILKRDERDKNRAAAPLKAAADAHNAGTTPFAGDDETPSSESQAGMPSERSVSLVSAGTTPRSFWRARVSSRTLSQPWSNWPLNFAIHSLGA